MQLTKFEFVIKPSDRKGAWGSKITPTLSARDEVIE